jgi:hypothetical protein
MIGGGAGLAEWNAEQEALNAVAYEIAEPCGSAQKSSACRFTISSQQSTPATGLRLINTRDLGPPALPARIV